jgi:imidazolonepropionase-like amidohydrolase
MKLMSPIAQENLRQIHAAGGVLALGTDQSVGPAVHREMELLAAAGIAPIDVIRIATLNAAAFLGRAHDLGSIEEGKIADLVLLGADPAIRYRQRQTDRIRDQGRPGHRPLGAGPAGQPLMSRSARLRACRDAGPCTTNAD